MGRLDYTFKPSRERDGHGKPERKPRLCHREGCEESAVFGSKYCDPHAKEYRAEVEAAINRKKRTLAIEKAYLRREKRKNAQSITAHTEARENAVYEPARFESVYDREAATELQKARRRFRWLADLSDDEIIALHRIFPVRDFERGVS